MAQKRSTNKRQQREQAAAALTPETSAAPKKGSDSWIAERVAKDQGAKQARQQKLDEAAKAARAPKPKPEVKPGLALTGAGGLRVEAGSPEAKALAKAIKTRTVVGRTAKKALKEANEAGKRGTKAATAGQRREQGRLDEMGAAVASQQAEARTRVRMGLDEPTLSPAETKKHSMIIARAIREHGHLNHPDVQPSVQALGNRHAAYIASTELDKMSKE